MAKRAAINFGIASFFRPAGLAGKVGKTIRGSGDHTAESPSTAAATIPRTKRKSDVPGASLPFFVFSGSSQ